MIRNILGASIALAMCGLCQPALASEGTSEGFPPQENYNYYHVPGPDIAADGTAALLGGSEYLFVAGSALTPRASSTTITYPGGGCISSTGDFVLTSLNLPQGAEVIGIRLYYYNNGSASSANVALTSYSGSGGSSDLIFGTASGNTGYLSEFFGPATPLLIDNGGQSYAMLASMGAGLRVCGMRVFYSP